MILFRKIIFFSWMAAALFAVLFHVQNVSIINRVFVFYASKIDNFVHGKIHKVEELMVYPKSHVVYLHFNATVLQLYRRIVLQVYPTWVANSNYENTVDAILQISLAWAPEITSEYLDEYYTVGVLNLATSDVKAVISTDFTPTFLHLTRSFSNQGFLRFKLEMQSNDWVKISLTTPPRVVLVSSDCSSNYFLQPFLFISGSDPEFSDSIYVFLAKTYSYFNSEFLPENSVNTICGIPIPILLKTEYLFRKLLEKSSNDFWATAVHEFFLFSNILQSNNISLPLRFKSSKVLLAITTCCEMLMHANVSLSLRNFFDQLLSSLVASNDKFDIVVFDDASGSENVDYMNFLRQKLGLRVISWSKPRGLTFAWNNAYRLFVEENYDVLFFVNNDVLIPSTAVSSMANLLLSGGNKKLALLTCLTTDRGSGHVKSQRVSAFYPYLDPTFTNHPLMFGYVNYWINSKYAGSKEILNAKSVEPIIVRPQTIPRFKILKYFNGFFFGVNRQIISAAYDSVYLFDPSKRNVGQENDLIERMNRAELLAGLDTKTFIYHYKAVTMKFSKKTKDSNKFAHGWADQRDDMSKFH